MAKIENATTLVKERGGVEGLHSGADFDVDKAEAIRFQVLHHRHGIPRSLVGLIGAHHYGESRS